MRRLLFAVLLLVLVPGCVRGGGAAFGAGLLLGAALSVHQHGDGDVYVTNQVVYVPTTVVPESTYASLPRRDTPAEEDKRSAFDANAARATLGALNVGACRTRGAPRGYGHAKVTFAATGSARAVVIDAPRDLSPDAVACLGQMLGNATVPEFSGDEMTVGTTFFVP